MRIIVSSNITAINRLIDRKLSANSSLRRRVSQIVNTVRRNGDRALLAYSRRFDQLQKPIEITREEIKSGSRKTPQEVRLAIRTAAQHIRTIARHQLPKNWEKIVIPGVKIEQRVTPLDRIGCYVPGGRYPLPSSLLMTAIPARVAGVQEVFAACPRPEPAVLTAAIESGITRLFRIGGAHTIAAFAYGTETVPKVDKIVGPGNTYVATAKEIVSNDCAIDFYAGPTEIVIISQQGNPKWLAADLIAQAEHDPAARAILLTPNRRLATQVARQVAIQLPRSGSARNSLRDRGAIVVTNNLQEAIKIANRIAPEHLVCERQAVANAVTRAGTIFIGAYAAQAAGDYATGSNHVLPTNGAARFRGGLSAVDFVRVTNLQRVTRQGLARLAPTILSLADAEGLSAHATSIQVRLK